MDLVDAVARKVLAQLFEIAALPSLALRVDAKLPALEKERGHVLAFVEHVWIHAQFGARGVARARPPKAKRRGNFQPGAIEKILAALARRAGPIELRKFSAGGQQRQARVLRDLDFTGKGEADPQGARNLRRIVDAHWEVGFLIFLQTREFRELDADSRQSRRRERSIEENDGEEATDEKCSHSKRRRHGPADGSARQHNHRD
jgi:hypothetical protein